MPTALAALLALLARSALGEHAPGDVVQPKIVLPGEWLTDQAEKFLFLPLTVPADIKLDQCKVMTNGNQILVVVTEKPNEEPETNAIKKYKLVIEAIKKEASNDEKMLKDKLTEWLDTEDDEEVRVQVKSTLDSLQKVRAAKQNTTPRTVSVPLGALVSQAVAVLNATLPATAFLAKASAHGTARTEPTAAPAAEPEEAQEAEHVLTSLHHVKDTQADGDMKVSIIKESFAIEIPYPVPGDKIFLLRTKPESLMVSMPLVRKSLEASGISTGGKPFGRVPVFGVQGEQLAGPKTANLPTLASGLHVPSVADHKSLKPLS